MFAIDTFGPFTVHASDGEVDTPSFWRQVDSVRRDLRGAFGLYVFAVRRADGSTLPWYVGKTESSFHVRFSSHLRTKKILNNIQSECGNASVEIFLIAFMNAEKTSIAKANTTSRKKWLDFLETALIVASFRTNKKILNQKKTIVPKQVPIPGFLGDDPKKRNKSAMALAELLQVS